MEEELCVEKVVGQLPEATPFFDHGSKILVKGGQVGSSLLSLESFVAPNSSNILADP